MVNPAGKAGRADLDPSAADQAGAGTREGPGSEVTNTLLGDDQRRVCRVESGSLAY